MTIMLIVPIHTIADPSDPQTCPVDWVPIILTDPPPSCPGPAAASPRPPGTGAGPPSSQLTPLDGDNTEDGKFIQIAED